MSALLGALKILNTIFTFGFLFFEPFGRPRGLFITEPPSASAGFCGKEVNNHSRYLAELNLVPGTETMTSYPTRVTLHYKVVMNELPKPSNPPQVTFVTVPRQSFSSDVLFSLFRALPPAKIVRFVRARSGFPVLIPWNFARSLQLISELDRSLCAHWKNIRRARDL